MMTESTPTPTPAGSMADLAYERILHMLVTLDIGPGDPIQDEILMKRLDIGRTPVREAIKRLEADKLVITYPKRGTFATKVELSDLSFISEIRQQLEPMAAARAARTASASMREELVLACDEIRNFDISAATTAQILNFDAKVHRLIYRAAGNPYLESVLIRHSHLATRIWCLVLDRLPRPKNPVEEHLKLLQFIVDGNEEMAFRVASEHVAHFESAVRVALLNV